MKPCLAKVQSKENCWGRGCGSVAGCLSSVPKVVEQLLVGELQGDLFIPHSIIMGQLSDMHVKSGNEVTYKEANASTLNDTDLGGWGSW